MNSSNKQLVLILILIVALLLHMEGFAAGMFANEEEGITLCTLVDGVEFKAIIDSKGFDKNEELLIRACYTNKSNKPINNYDVDISEGFSPALGASLLAWDKSSRFSDAAEIKSEEISDVNQTYRDVLKPGEAIEMNFSMLPIYKEGGVVKLAKPGEYILSLWYSTNEDRVIKADFPVTIEKKYGKMYIKQ